MGKKKPFINKNAEGTYSYRLVHRSQKDPLAADSESSPFVLQQYEKKDGGERRDAPEQSPDAHPSGKPRAGGGDTALSRKEEQLKYGVFFDDEYDYMQHLRPSGAPDAAVAYADEKELARLLKNPDRERVTEPSQGLALPPELFASTQEEEVGLLNRAAPVTGLRLDMDPDIVAAMDEDFNFEDVGNMLDDDFLTQAQVSEGESDGELTPREEEIGSDGLFSGSEGEGGWSDGGDRFDQGDGAIDFSAVRRAYQPDAEDTKSRFTEYSMTSSILPRSEKLQLHDDRFEEFYAQYDDEKMGALEEEAEALDEAGAGSKEVDQFQGVFDEFIEKHSNARGVFFGHIPQDEKDRDIAREATEVGLEQAEQEPEFPTDEEIMSYTPYEVKHKPEHDCESILSTRSTLFNHPTIISDRVAPKDKIKLDKFGMPVGAFDTRGRRNGKEPEEATAPSSEEEEEPEEPRENKGARRSKTETKEEKAARKKAIKEERRLRRATKKATTEAFNAEERRQITIRDNARRNLQGKAL